MKILPLRNVLASRGNPLQSGVVAEVSEKIGRFLVGIGKAVEVAESAAAQPQEDEDDENESPSEQPKKRGRKPASLTTANTP